MKWKINRKKEIEFWDLRNSSTKNLCYSLACSLLFSSHKKITCVLPLHFYWSNYWLLFGQNWIIVLARLPHWVVSVGRRKETFLFTIWLLKREWWREGFFVENIGIIRERKSCEIFIFFWKNKKKRKNKNKNIEKCKFYF